MATGPGKYDDLCTQVRETTEAEGAIVIVFGGNRGEGFSCQANMPTLMRLPLILRSMADSIEGDLPACKKGEGTRPEPCECDNTHEQNKTCCRPCWDAGFRTVNNESRKRG